MTLLKYYRCYLILLLFINLDVIADTNDHLIARYTISSSDYAQAIQLVFKTEEKNSLLNVIVIPTFGDEYMVSVNNSGNSYKVVLFQPEHNILDILYTREITGLKRNDIDLDTVAKKASLKIQEKEIANKLALKLKSIWENELIYARKFEPPSSPPMTLDGTKYTFTTNTQKFGVMRGTLRDYKKQSRMSALIELVDELKKFSLGGIDEETIAHSVIVYEKKMHEIGIAE